MATQGLAQKLRIARGNSILLVNAPGDFTEKLVDLPDGASVTTALSGHHDVVMLFVRDRPELNRSLQRAIDAVREGGILWIAWQKKSQRGPADLNRDSLWAAIQPFGWGPISNVTLDDEWSALRFKPESEIKRVER